MLGRIRRNIKFANVVSMIALFCALGGGAYAAVSLPKNSVGTKQLKKNAVTSAKVGKNAVTSAKIKSDSVTGAKVKNGSLTGADINLATLPKVGSAATADNAAHATNADNATNATNATNAAKASQADHAVNADNIAAPEAFREIGAPNQPGFLGGSTNFGTITGAATGETAGFYKDKEGVVHLKGLIRTADSGTDAGALFNLPAGYRPGNTKVLLMPAFCSATGTGTCTDSGETTILILGAGTGLVTSPGLNPDGLLIATAGVTVDLDGITFRAAG
jgi:hypothetical protein